MDHGSGSELDLLKGTFTKLGRVTEPGTDSSVEFAQVQPSDGEETRPHASDLSSWPPLNCQVLACLYVCQVWYAHQALRSVMVMELELEYIPGESGLLGSSRAPFTHPPRAKRCPNP